MRQAFYHHICVGIFLLFSNIAWGQTFKASHIQKAYEKLQLGSNPQLMKSLSVRTDENGVIEHIGVPLFPQKMRTLLPSPIYDYLEYALLDHQYHINDNTLQHQRIRFRNGNWNDLLNVRPTDDCNISNTDDKWYTVTWHRQQGSDISVAIPIDYELLANSNRKEMEKTLLRELQQFKIPKAQRTAASTDHLQKTRYENVFVKKGHSYLLPEMNNDTYYWMTNQSRKPVLFIDQQHPAESFANILLKPADTDILTMLSIEFMLSGYQKAKVKVGIRQWLSFCQSKGCEPYYLYEETSEGSSSALLLMYNKNEGYAHLLHLNGSLGDLKDKKLLCLGKGYMYIPTSNLASLFGQVTKDKSTPKKY